MAMEFLSFNDQLVAGFSRSDQDDNLVALDIIQGMQVSHS
jgi:hypothetical protein